MKLLILNYEYPPLGGGAGVCAMHHAEGLIKYGHQITLVTTWYENQEEFEIKEKHTIIRLKAKRKHKHSSSISEKLSWMFAARKFLLKYCLANTFDLCLSHFTLPGGFVAKALKRRFSIPYVIISHGHDIPWFFPKQMFIYHLLLYPVIKNIARSASGIVVLNETLKNSAKRFLGKQRESDIYVIPNGSHFNSDTERTSHKDELLKIIFTGRLVAQKDPMTFLKAIKIFKGKGYDFRVEIIGDGDLKEKMMRYVKQHMLEPQVVFRGWIDKEAMHDVYTHVQVHVATSLYEAMSLGTLETATSGIYLITTAAGSNADLISENVNGNIVPKKNPVAIARYLMDYYENKFLKAYVIPAQVINELKQRYGWSNIIGKYQDLVLNIRK